MGFTFRKIIILFGCVYGHKHYSSSPLSSPPHSDTNDFGTPTDDADHLILSLTPNEKVGKRSKLLETSQMVCFWSINELTWIILTYVKQTNFLSWDEWCKEINLLYVPILCRIFHVTSLNDHNQAICRQNLLEYTGSNYLVMLQ